MGFSDFVALPPYLSELIDYVAILFPNPACTVFHALALHSVALLVVAGGQLLMMMLRLFLPVTWVLLLGRVAWQYFPSSSFVCHVQYTYERTPWTLALFLSTCGPNASRTNLPTSLGDNATSPVDSKLLLTLSRTSLVKTRSETLPDWNSSCSLACRNYSCVPCVQMICLTT